jgi:hypothetical protein
MPDIVKNSQYYTKISGVIPEYRLSMQHFKKVITKGIIYGIQTGRPGTY